MAWLWELKENACTGCGICKDMCQEQAIAMTRNMPLPVPVPEACTGCGSCVHQCPFGAIALRLDQGLEHPPATPG